MKLSNLNKDKLKWLLSLIKKDLRWVVGTMVLGVFAAFLGLVVSIFSQKLIDTIIPSHDLNKLFIGLSIAFGILLLKIAMTSLQQYLGARHNQIFNLRLIDEYFKQLLFLPKSFFDEHDTGALIARMNDSSSIQQTITYIANTLILNVLILIVSTTVIFFYSVGVGLIALAALPIFFTIALVHRKKLAENVRIVMEENAKKESNYISTIQNTDLLKTHNKEELFAKINHDTYGAFQKSVFNSAMTGLRISTTSEFTGNTIYILMLSFASYQMILGHITVGEFAATLGIATGMLAPIGTLGFAILQFQGASIAFDRMYEFISREPEYLKEEDKKKPLLDKINSIEFDDVSFSYKNNIKVLKDLSFKVNKGEMICIFGKNGSGKSTILKLLMYLYKPNQGAIRLNGINLNELSIAGFRDKVAIVSQQSKLFDRTVIENICFETDYNEIEKAIAFLSDLGFDKYIGKLSEGYHTQVYGNGDSLSGGQKQMISLARALCKKPDVLLLDEPTASMDGEAEDFVIDTLKNFKKHGIVLIVTHKQNPARESDKIVILSDGIFQDSGTPNELMLGDNLYSKSFSDLELQRE